jgi:hypothetical protein
MEKSGSGINIPGPQRCHLEYYDTCRIFIIGETDTFILRILMKGKAYLLCEIGMFLEQSFQCFPPILMSLRAGGIELKKSTITRIWSKIQLPNYIFYVNAGCF